MSNLYYLNEGDIMKAKPKHFIPRPEGAGNVGQHPVIVIASPDPNGYVLVAPMSHNHPDGTPTTHASRYGLPVDPIKGESRVNIGYPKVIHQDNLRPNKPHAAMNYNDYLALKGDICKRGNEPLGGQKHEHATADMLKVSNDLPR